MIRTLDRQITRSPGARIPHLTGDWYTVHQDSARLVRGPIERERP